MLLVIIVSVLIYSDALFISVFFEVFLEATNTIVSFLSGDIVGARMAGSDSIRVFFWEKSLSIWSEHPLFGTGFAGIYQFSDIGSTHNQYLDVLLRSGIIGLLLYLTLWLNLLRFYFYRPEIAAGMFAIFTYGFLHETTKLSYTGLLFVLLLSKMFQEKRRLQLPTPLKRA